MLVNVGARPTSLQVTVTLWVVMVLHDGELGDTVTEIFTGPAVAGQVNVGFSMFGSSNVPAVAVQDAQEQGPGVQVHAGVESVVGGGLEVAHGEGLRFGVVRRGGGWAPPPSSHARAFMSIQPLQQTGPAVRSFEVQRPPRSVRIVSRSR